MTWVTITHPELPGQTARVSRKAFDQVYSQQEPPWQLADAGAVQLDTEPDTATDEVAEEDE